MTEQEQTPDQLSEVLAQVVDDYLDEVASLEEVDSLELGQQLAAVVVERRLPPGVQYVSTTVDDTTEDSVLRRAWGH